jgi:hypothetical protein
MGQPGNCGNGIRPYKFSLDDLKDVAKGSDKQMEKGCGYGDFDVTNEGNLREKGFGWPENGEFEYGGRGDNCNLCDGEYGCECNQTNHVPGKRGKVRRRQYKADPKECCLANMESKDKTKTIGDYTCDPTYRNPGNTECGNYYSDYCKESNNLFNPNCQALKNTNSSLYNILMTEKCNTNEHYKNNTCLAWCNEAESNSCTMLNSSNRCEEYQITEPECTLQKINEVQAKCLSYKLTESKIGAGTYACTLNGVKTLEDKCKEYNIDLGSCSQTAVEDELNRVFQAEQNDITRQQMAEQFNTAQTSLNEVLGIEKKPKPKPEDSEDYTMYIIIAIILIFLFMSFSGIVGVLLIGGEESE